MAFYSAEFAEINKVVKNIESEKKYKMLVVLSVPWDYACFYFCTFVLLLF